METHWRVWLMNCMLLCCFYELWLSNDVFCEWRGAASVCAGTKGVTWVCPLPVRVGLEMDIRDTEPGFSLSANVFVIYYLPTSDSYCIFHSYTDAMYFWQLTPSNKTPPSASVLRLMCLICVWSTCCPVFCRFGAFAEQWRRATVGFKCLPWWNFDSPIGWISWYLVFGIYTEICWRNVSFGLY
jgi:hypothetical protein